MRELDVAAIEERRHLALAGLVRAFPGIPSVLGLGVHGLDATDGPIDAVEQTVAGHLASVLVGLWRLGAGAPVRITDLEEAVEPGAVPKGFTDDLRVVVRLTGRDANPRGQVLPRDVVSANDGGRVDYACRCRSPHHAKCLCTITCRSAYKFVHT